MAREFTRRLTWLRRALSENWSDMDYAQRRLFEIRTGTVQAGAIERARDKALLAELEAHWRI